MAPKQKGKGKMAKDTPQPVERPEDDVQNRNDDEDDGLNDTIVSFFEDRPYFCRACSSSWIARTASISCSLLMICLNCNCAALSQSGTVGGIFVFFYFSEELRQVMKNCQGGQCNVPT